MALGKKLIFVLCFFVAFVLLLATQYAGSGQNGCVVGAKNCTEQHILGEIIAQVIEQNTDVKVVRRFNLEGSSICFEALRSGSIDLYCEYTGTALLSILKEPLTEQQVLLQHVQERFQTLYGMIWLEPLGFSNHYVLATRAHLAIKTLSDLSLHPHYRLAYDPEFAARLESSLLKEGYEISQKPFLMDQVLLYLSLEKKGVDVVSGFATDSRLAEPDVVILEDNKNCLPKYDVAPIMKEKFAKRYPQVVRAINQLKGRIDEQTMRDLNYQVEHNRQTPHEVAAEFLRICSKSPGF